MLFYLTPANGVAGLPMAPENVARRDKSLPSPGLTPTAYWSPVSVFVGHNRRHKVIGGWIYKFNLGG